MLFILKEAGGKLEGATRLQKIAFLITMEAKMGGIGFEPSEYGPYSSAIANAVKELEGEGIIRVTRMPVPGSDKGYKEVYELMNKSAVKGVDGVFGRHALKRGVAKDIIWLWKDAPLIALIEYVYRKYPEYAVESIIKDKIDAEKALSKRYPHL